MRPILIVVAASVEYAGPQKHNGVHTLHVSRDTAVLPDPRYVQLYIPAVQIYITYSTCAVYGLTIQVTALSME